MSESGTASGVRRIEAVTGVGTLNWIENVEVKLKRIAKFLRTDIESIEPKLSAHIEKTRKQEKELEQLKGKIANTAGSDMVSDAETIEGIKIIAKSLNDIDPKTLRDTVDQLKNKLGTAAIILATVNHSKVNLVAGVTQDATDRIKAGELVNHVAQQVGGKGGGRKDMAQAGGNDPSGLEAALKSVPDWIRDQI